MTTKQKGLAFLIAIIPGAIIPIASYPLIDKCTPIGDATFWLPLAGATCFIELIGQIGRFLVGFVFTVVFLIVMAAQLLLMGTLQITGVIDAEFIRAMSNPSVEFAVFISSIANTIFYWCIILAVISFAQKTKSASHKQKQL
jgi:hypothetical protein